MSPNRADRAEARTLREVVVDPSATSAMLVMKPSSQIVATHLVIVAALIPAHRIPWSCRVGGGGGHECAGDQGYQKQEKYCHELSSQKNAADDCRSLCDSGEAGVGFAPSTQLM